MKGISTALIACALGCLVYDPAVQAQTEKVLYSFCSQTNCADGEYPYAGVLRVKNKLYTTTSTGGGNGNNQGTLNAINMKTGAATFVYSFSNYVGDGAHPESGLIEVNGTLYGVTTEGGAGDGGNGAGTLYSLNKKEEKEKVLYSFCSEQNCADGAWPDGDLLYMNGVLYGTTGVGGGGVESCGGPYPGCGTVVSFEPATGAEKVLYAFCQAENCADGRGPVGSLIDLNGNLYGTTADGGGGSGCSDEGGGCGTVFALDPATGTETVLHTFGGETDGGTPVAGLINVNGTLFGTTEYGGGRSPCVNGYEDGCGTVFSIDPATGAETVVHSFQNNGSDGQNPIAGLIEVRGKLYGTTEWGGKYGYGTVFSLDLKTGKETVLYSFCSQQNCADGAIPYAGLTNVKGTLYGTTEWGGAGCCNTGGTVFSIVP